MRDNNVAGVGSKDVGLIRGTQRFILEDICSENFNRVRI